MVLLRRVIGDALRARRQGQHRTLREVSSAANVSLGYLSEIERGQKEASSELLAAICDALGARLSELLRDVSETVEVAERVPDVLVPVQGERPGREPVPASATPARGAGTGRPTNGSSTYRAEPARPRSDGDPAAQPARGEPVRQSARADGLAARPAGTGAPGRGRADSGVRQLPADSVRQITTDGTVSVTVRQESPLKATLRATRRIHPNTNQDRDVVCVG
ncbi:helix-turn-helix domain-containing protein [Plantactinospora sonchi]